MQASDTPIPTELLPSFEGRTFFHPQSNRRSQNPITNPASSTTRTNGILTPAQPPRYLTCPLHDPRISLKTSPAPTVSRTSSSTPAFKLLDNRPSPSDSRLRQRRRRPQGRRPPSTGQEPTGGHRAPRPVRAERGQGRWVQVWLGFDRYVVLVFSLTFRLAFAFVFFSRPRRTPR